MCDDDEDQIMNMDAIKVGSKLPELATFDSHSLAPTQTISQKDPNTEVKHPQDQNAGSPVSEGSAALTDPPGDQFRLDGNMDEEMNEEMEKCLEKHDKKYCENKIAAKFLERLIRDGIIY